MLSNISPVQVIMVGHISSVTPVNDVDKTLKLVRIYQVKQFIGGHHMPSHKVKGVVSTYFLCELENIEGQFPPVVE
jgi:hypothetical protein